MFLPIHLHKETFGKYCLFSFHVHLSLKSYSGKRVFKEYSNRSVINNSTGEYIFPVIIYVHPKISIPFSNLSRWMTELSRYHLFYVPSKNTFRIKFRLSAHSTITRNNIISAHDSASGRRLRMRSCFVWKQLFRSSFSFKEYLLNSFSK